MSRDEELKELLDGFIEYRNALVPLQESLKRVGDVYEEIRGDLDVLLKNFSGESVARLERVHARLSQQAGKGQELSAKIDEYAASGEKYARAVDGLTKRFGEIDERLAKINAVEDAATRLLSKLDAIVAEKSASYNLKDLQKSLDGYNRNVERISDFINNDIAATLSANAEKIDSIRRENEQLAAVVGEQGRAVDELCATFTATSALLKKTVEGGSVNEQYLFDAFDRWAADRKVKIKKK